MGWKTKEVMMKIQATTWLTLSEMYAFIANSFLSPMKATTDMGLSADFWETFLPDAKDEKVKSGIAKLVAYANAVSNMSREEAVQQCSVEYTKLFIGPPSPAAPPWETMNKSDGATSAFGQATFAMKQYLRDIGLKVSNANNQYEDHIGIELLYLSEICRRYYEDIEGAQITKDCPLPSISDIKSFINEHPLSWVETLHGKIETAFPKGYFIGLAELTQGVLEGHLQLLSFEQK